MSLLAGAAFYDYQLLNRSSKAEILCWTPISRSASDYTVMASYKYSDGKENFEGKTAFKKLRFLNQYAASAQIKEFEKESWKVYYNAKLPQISSLQKLFPFKAFIDAILVFGVFLYFIFLDRWLFSLKGS